MARAAAGRRDGRPVPGAARRRAGARQAVRDDECGERLGPGIPGPTSHAAEGAGRCPPAREAAARAAWWHASPLALLAVATPISAARGASDLRMRAPPVPCLAAGLLSVASIASGSLRRCRRGATRESPLIRPCRRRRGRGEARDRAARAAMGCAAVIAEITAELGLAPGFVVGRRETPVPVEFPWHESVS